MIEAWPSDEGVRRVRDLFAAVSGGARPDGVWSAPGRVNVIGEHTDYTGGRCLPAALPHRTYVALRRRADDVVRLASAQEPTTWTGRLDDVDPGRVEGWAGYAVGVAWALREAGLPVGGFDAVVDSCVPTGAGLSSSAALGCAVAVALNDVHGLGLAGSDRNRARLAAACVRAENEVVGAPTGGMDQAVSLRCRAGHALLLDAHDGSVRHVPLDLAGHGLALLVVDTRSPHRLVDGPYADRRDTCAAAARVLGRPLREVTPADLDAADGLDDVMRRRVRHVVTENARVDRAVDHLDAGEPAAIGPLLTASHASLRDDHEVSGPELDLAVDAALGAGALGARLVGGGFGGSVLALVPADDVARVGDAVVAAFTRAGRAEPGLLQAVAGPPAERDA